MRRPQDRRRRLSRQGVPVLCGKVGVRWASWRLGRAPDSCAQMGRTPLMIAGHLGCESVLRELLAAGADVNVADKVPACAELAAAARARVSTVCGVMKETHSWQRIQLYIFQRCSHRFSRRTLFLQTLPAVRVCAFSCCACARGYALFVCVSISA
jgi:hypothetical protein